MPAKRPSSIAFSCGMFLISGTILCLQLLHMRILSFVMWQSLVYSVITVALLGFGVSGTFLSVWRHTQTVREETFLCWACVGMGVASLLTMYAGSLFSVDAFYLLESPRVIVKLLVYFGLLMVPYLFGAAAIAFVLARHGGRANLYYGINMVGSGVGCLCFLLLITPLGAQKLLVVLSISAAVAGALFAWPGWKGGFGLATLTALVGVILLPVAEKAWDFRPCVSKLLGRVQIEQDDLQSEFSKWTPTGRLDVVSSESFIWENPQTKERWPFKYLTTDGDAWTPLFEYMPTPGRTFIPHRWGAVNLAYKLKEEPEVLVIGVGGAKGLREAIEQGAQKVLGIELNRTATEVVREHFAEYLGHIIQDPRVTLEAAEGRSYVQGQPEERFDLLIMNGVDTWAALSSGAYAMAEDYLYTVEALRDYLRVMREDGIVSISRRSFSVPRETLRLSNTALYALRAEGADEPWSHLAVMQAYDWATILMKKSPFTEGEISIIEGRSDEGWYNIIYRPGIEDLETNEETLSRYGRAWEPSPYDGSVNHLVAFVRELKDGNEEEFYRDYVYDVRPVTDNNPFFFKYYKFSGLFSRTGEGIEFNAGGGSLALLVLVLLLVVAISAVALFMFLPLFVWSRRRESRFARAGALRFGVYFTGLGIGYMFVEISLMQKLSLFLGHPTYAIATVLASMLVFSGLGSLASEYLRMRLQRLMIISIALTCVLLAVLVYEISLLTAHGLALPLIWRNIVVALTLAPLAFVMGIPFPTGLRLARDRSESLIPWAWGVNGAAGVLASVMAVIIAMNFGFTVVLVLAATAYLGGCAALMSGGLHSRVDSA